ncbi:hypothetical protein HPB48_019940 [Haemaphysalis longicornis]|uniref:Uncharacterized protein n=1 Tax=Haemaphysalis longicornis TaxID=44386 RepID=A0A9J6F9W8_HAELO|nr:hypothetical protein HPB48_019940 [Haemaphysalis longicornis]
MTAKSDQPAATVFLAAGRETKTPKEKATNTTWRRANFKLRVDQNQNRATVSTPAEEVAEKFFRVTKIMIEGTEQLVELYGPAPDDAVKGVIQGVPKRLTIQEIKENILQDGFEIYTARRIGNDSTTVLLTFSWPKVPHCIWLYGWIIGAPCTRRPGPSVGYATKWVTVALPAHSQEHELATCAA